MSAPRICIRWRVSNWYVVHPIDDNVAKENEVDGSSVQKRKEEINDSRGHGLLFSQRVKGDSTEAPEYHIGIGERKGGF